MRFIAFGSELDTTFPSLAPDEARALGRAEARRAWELYQEGVIREINFRSDRHSSIMLLEAADAAAAQAALATLPFVRAGILSFEVVGLLPYDGWARLFTPERPVPG